MTSRRRCRLSVQIKDGLVGAVGALQQLGGGEVVDRRKHAEHRAGAHNEQIEIRGER